MAEESTQESSNTDSVATESDKNYTADEVKTLRKQIEDGFKTKYADYDALKAKAEQFDAAAEAQKSEAQKAIDAALKERDEALATVTKSQREIALTKASIPEDEWDDFADWSPAQIAKYGEKAAAQAGTQEPLKPPTQRGREQFISGSGSQDASPSRSDLKKTIDSIPRR